MMNFNLLRERKTVRDTVTPKTPVPGRRPPFWRRRSFFLMSAFVCALALWMWSIGVEVKINVDQLFGVETSPAPAKTPQTVKKAITPPQPVVAAVPQEKKPAPVPSRPVARDALAAAPSEDVGEVWSTRFALCVYRRSCDEVMAALKKKGVDTYIEESSATILSHRIVIGPWTGRSEAEKAMGELKAKGMETSPFSAGGNFYLSTDSSIDMDSVSKMKDKVVSMGYRAEVSSKKEPRKVFKVYTGRWEDEETARKKLADYRRRGIECIVEKH